MGVGNEPDPQAVKVSMLTRQWKLDTLEDGIKGLNGPSVVAERPGAGNRSHATEHTAQREGTPIQKRPPLHGPGKWSPLAVCLRHESPGSCGMRACIQHTGSYEPVKFA